VTPFDYHSWQEDHQLAPDDEDFEWTAHILVLADSAEAAQSWGDRLVRDLCSHSRDVFLRSTVEPHVCAASVTPGKMHACPNFPKPSGGGYFDTPVVVGGEAATAEYIGW
jgi:hypothetical protein